MPRPFALPDLGEGLTEAEIVKVLVGEGDVVAEDAPLLEVETDKATVEIPSPYGGRVASIHVQPGQTVKVGQVLVTFDDTGAPAPGGTSRSQSSATGAPARRAPSTASTPAAAPAGTSAGPVPATPATRRLARELGVDLRAVRATGPAGRVTDDDVRSAAGGAQPGTTAPVADGRAPERVAVAKPLAAVGVEPPPLPDRK